MNTAQTSLVRVAQKITLILALAVALYCFLSSAQRPTLAQAGDNSPAENISSVIPNKLTGADSSECAACHEQVAEGFARTVHGKVQNGLSVSCESCHGDGAEHIAGGGDKSKIKNPAKVNPATASQTCMQCHSQVKEHAQWRGSKHESAGLSCLSCHSAHHSKAATTVNKFAASFREPAAETKLLKGASITDTCFQCHSNIRKAQYQRSTHLFRNEDREHTQNCSSCHEPHGSIGPKMMRTATVNETCYQCHDEKRGPFLWEHAPVRESCLTCHFPHGSNHAKLQRVAVPYLCQQCHANTRHPGTLYDARNTPEGTSPSNRLVERGCVNCHSAVHGSNHPSSPYLAH